MFLILIVLCGGQSIPWYLLLYLADTSANGRYIGTSAAFISYHVKCLTCWKHLFQQVMPVCPPSSLKPCQLDLLSQMPQEKANCGWHRRWNGVQVRSSQTLKHPGGLETVVKKQFFCRIRRRSWNSSLVGTCRATVTSCHQDHHFVFSLLCLLARCAKTS